MGAYHEKDSFIRAMSVWRCMMPEKQTLKRARKAKREGKASSTQAGEFVREEIEHVRRGKHGARSTKQAIAIGLSKARREQLMLAHTPSEAIDMLDAAARSATQGMVW